MNWINNLSDNLFLKSKTISLEKKFLILSFIFINLMTVKPFI